MFHYCLTKKSMEINEVKNKINWPFPTGMWHRCRIFKMYFNSIFLVMFVPSLFCHGFVGCAEFTGSQVHMHINKLLTMMMNMCNTMYVKLKKLHHQMMHHHTPHHLYSTYIYAFVVYIHVENNMHARTCTLLFDMFEHR